jgi:hypothetical protein
MIPEFELAKTVHALDRAVTVIGYNNVYRPKLFSLHRVPLKSIKNFDTLESQTQEPGGHIQYVLA